MKSLRYVALVLVASSHALILSTNCQASDGDERFQAYHQDIGRISGSASRAAVAAPTQTVLRAAQPVPEVEHPVRQLAAPARARVVSQSPPARKPNRITLAVRTHAPVQVVATGAQPDVAPLDHFQPQPQPQHQPQQQQGPQQSPFTPLAAPSFQPTFQSLAPAELPAPVAPSSHHQRSLAGSVTARHSALMAQVAAERHHQVETAVAQPALASFASQSPSPSQAVAAQVQPPPLLFQQPQQAAAAASSSVGQLSSFVDQPEEPLVAPSFDQVLSKGCPPKGVFSWENRDFCDRYYMCTNGTFTEEACPNGLGYSQIGAVYQHCAYNWNVDCGTKKSAEPLASPGCPWQFGIFPVASQVGRCSIDYYVCEWGVPETKRCSPEGLFYDDRIKGCQWADQLGCKSEALLNFKCPPEDEDNPYWPYPRYYHTKQDVIVCVNEQPRLVHCTEEQAVDPSSLACVDLRPKKKKF